VSERTWKLLGLGLYIIHPLTNQPHSILIRTFFVHFASTQLSVTDVQSNMKQNIVVLAGSKTFIRDALLTAGLCKQIFPPNNVLIVPVKTDALPEGNGFKVVDGPTNTNTNTRPYVATPLGEGWSTLIDNELEDAKSQGNGARAKLEGIVLVVSSQGKIVRRGLGLPEWRELVEKF